MARLVQILLLLILTARAEGQTWAELAPAERQALLPMAEQWDSLEPETRDTLLRGARRWVELSPEERRKVRERFGEWQALPPERRVAIRERFARFQAMTPAEQRTVRRLYQRFNELPAERRAELRRRFHDMSPGERQAFVQGAELGRQLELRGSSRTGVSRGVLARARIVSRDLTPAARRALRQRLLAGSPEDQDALLTELERMSAADREAHLLPERP